MSHPANDIPTLSNATEDSLLCGACGYDVRGIDARVCPECGRGFDPDLLIDQLMPWEQRRHVGRVRAYLRTIGLATFHPTRAAERVTRPMDVPAARRFRRIVWTITIVIFATMAITSRNRMMPRIPLGRLPSRAPASWQLLASPVSLSAAVCGTAIGLFAAMKLADLLFRSSRLTDRGQTRALAMAAYSCAPLGWLPLPLLLMLFTSPQMLAPARTPHWVDAGGELVAQILLLLIGVQWWLLTITLTRMVAGTGWPRTLLTFVFLPVLWIGFILGLAAVAIIAVSLVVLARQSLSWE